MIEITVKVTQELADGFCGKEGQRLRDPCRIGLTTEDFARYVLSLLEEDEFQRVLDIGLKVSQRLANLLCGKPGAKSDDVAKFIHALFSEQPQ